MYSVGASYQEVSTHQLLALCCVMLIAFVVEREPVIVFNPTAAVVGMPEERPDCRACAGYGFDSF